MLQWLDILIGLVVVLLGVSLIIMILTQILSWLLNLRGHNLKKGIEILIENTDQELQEYAKSISEAALSHPLITDAWFRPGYFKLASTIRPNELIKILRIVADSGEAEWQKMLKSKLTSVEKNVRLWFDNSMDRVTQSFIGKTRRFTVLFSILIAFTLQIDAFKLFEKISSDAELRAKLVTGTDIMLKRADVVFGSSEISSPYVDAVKKLKAEVTNLKGIDKPPSFKSRMEGKEWLEIKLAGNDKAEELLKRYNDLVDTNIKDSISGLKEQATSIKKILDGTKLQLIPDPYPGLLYPFKGRQFFGILIMAGLLSLGAPFWFNSLKTLSALRPVLAGKDTKERADRKP